MTTTFLPIDIVSSINAYNDNSVDVVGNYEVDPKGFEEYLRRYVHTIKNTYSEFDSEDTIYDANLSIEDIVSPVVLVRFETRDIDLSMYSPEFQEEYVYELIAADYDSSELLFDNVDPSILLLVLPKLSPSARHSLIISNIVIEGMTKYYSIVPELIEAYYPARAADVKYIIMSNGNLEQVLYTAIRKSDPRLAFELSI